LSTASALENVHIERRQPCSPRQVTSLASSHLFLSSPQGTKELQIMGIKETFDVKPFSKDKLMLVSRDKAASQAFAILDRLQFETPEVMMAATSLLFATWCQRLGMHPFEMHQLGLKMLKPEAFHLKGNAHLETLRDFAGIRMLGDAKIDTGAQ
jgi:hypothetical protein